MNQSIESTKNIKTRQDFVHFLEEFLVDFRTNQKEWENKDLESFLEALASYAEDIDAFYKNTNQAVDADKASWKVIADMLMGAKMYE